MARVWRVLPVTHRMDQGGWGKFTKGDFNATWTAMESGLKDKHTWSTVTSLVNGALAAEDLAALAKVPGHVTLTSLFAGTTFNVTKAGPVTFQLEGVAKPEGWIDGKPAKNLSAVLEPGTHTIVLRFDGGKLPESARLRSGDVLFLLN